MSWTTLFVIASGSILLKLAGVFGLGRLLSGKRTMAIGQLLPPALLAGLVVVQTFTSSSGDLVADARVPGVIAGAIAVWRGAPFWLVVLIAAAVTAGIRALGV